MNPCGGTGNHCGVAQDLLGVTLTLNLVSWNPIRLWLNRLDGFRRVAQGHASLVLLPGAPRPAKSRAFYALEAANCEKTSFPLTF